MGDIKIPLQFDELRDDSGSGFNVSDMMDEDACSPGDFTDILEDFSMAVESEIELEQRHVNAMFNMVACFKALSDEQKGDFAGNMISMCTQKVENLSEQSSSKSKNDFKMTHYFLHVLSAKAELSAPKAGGCDAAEKKAARGKKKPSSERFQWDEWRPSVLRLFQRTLVVDPSTVWFMGIPEEAFLAGMWKYALQLLEDKPVGIGGTGGAETALRAVCSDIILGCVRQLAGTSTTGDEMTTLCTAVLDSISRMEHMGPALADICRKENGRFSAQLMTEIGGMNLTDLSKSSTGVKNVGAFLVCMSESSPQLVANYFPTFIHLLDSEIYQIRSAIIHVMGSVVSYTHDLCVKAAKEDTPADPEGESEGPASERNQEQMKRVRDSILDMLIERTYDVTSFTRSAVLKTWASIAEKGAIPLSRFEAVAEVAVDRLQDRTAQVRKSAISLLISLLDNNPFGGVLAGAQFAAQQKDLEEVLKNRIVKLTGELKAQDMAQTIRTPSKVRVKREDADVKVEGSDNEEEEEEEPVVSDDEEEEQVEITEDTEVVTCRNGIKYCSAAVRFIGAVELSVPRLTQMLASKTPSDVVEALKFVARSVKFSVEPCASLLKSAFGLVWHQDEAITKECLNAFLSVYLTDGAIGVEPELLSNDQIARNLVDVCVQCGASELASMEKIIGLLFAENHLNSNAVGSLWTMTNTLSAKALITREGAEESVLSDAKVAERDLAGALRVIAMAAKFCPAILSPSRLNTVLSILLHSAVKANMMFPVVLASAQCLQNLGAEFSPTAGSTATDDDGSVAATRALLVDATEGICILLVGDFIKEDSKSSQQWFGAAEELLHAVFLTHPSPDLVLSRLVAVLYDRVFTAGATKDENKVAFKCSSGRLCRLLFVLGQGSICSLVYAEKVAGLAKKSREKKTLAAKEAAYSKNMMVASTGCALGEEEAEEADSMEQEMGMAAATDAEHEQNFNRVVEVDLVCNEQNMLGKFHQMISFIVANEKGDFSDPVVRENALLALCRYMTVSSHMCDTYLSLLFTALEHETSEGNKTTIMIALGDLAFRFPNSLEPWIGYMYARLSDDSLLVRYNTLMVLTHLILNDMIKVKGQVSHVVMCLNDKSDRVRGLAALFFSELSKRSNNPVYNLLGDVISFLSRDEDNIAAVSLDSAPGIASAVAHRKLTQPEFQSTMTFLLSFVKKDKQADSLLERLVVRMGVTAGQQQRRYLAFCISLLPITEKGVKKMTELMRHIKDSLTDDVISEYFKTCISRVKKSFVKGVAEEVNAVLEEFESAVAEIRGEGELLGDKPEALDTENDPEQVPQRVKPKAAKKAKAKPVKKRKAVVSSDEESLGDVSDVAESSEEDESEDTTPAPGAKRKSFDKSSKFLTDKNRRPLREVDNRG